MTEGVPVQVGSLRVFGTIRLTPLHGEEGPQARHNAALELRILNQDGTSYTTYHFDRHRLREDPDLNRGFGYHLAHRLLTEPGFAEFRDQLWRDVQTRHPNARVESLNGLNTLSEAFNEIFRSIEQGLSTHRRRGLNI